MFLFESGKLQWVDGDIPGSIEPLMSVYSAVSLYAGQSGWLSADDLWNDPD